jgi:hypothetical protein
MLSTQAGLAPQRRATKDVRGGRRGHGVRGRGAPAGNATGPACTFNHTASPFGFSVARAGRADEAPLFSTSGYRLVFKVRLG